MIRASAHGTHPPAKAVYLPLYVVIVMEDVLPSFSRARGPLENGFCNPQGHLNLQSKEELKLKSVRALGGAQRGHSVQKLKGQDRGQPTGRTLLGILGPSQEKWTQTLEQTPAVHSVKLLGKP